MVFQAEGVQQGLERGDLVALVGDPLSECGQWPGVGQDACRSRCQYRGQWVDPAPPATRIELTDSHKPSQSA